MSEVIRCCKCDEPALANEPERLFFDEAYQQYCQADAYWARHYDFDQEKLTGEPRGVVIGGQHFLVKPYNSTSPRHTLGFGGEEYRIEANDGTVLSTNNLWAQGKIPAQWKEEFPDNAHFAKLEVAPQLEPTSGDEDTLDVSLLSV